MTAQNESRILNDSFWIQHVILSSFWAHHSEWISLNDSFRMSQSEWRAHKEWVMTHSEWVMTHSEWVNSEWVIQTDVLWRARSILNDGLRMNSEWRAFRMESFRLNESLRLTCSQWIQNSKWLIQNSFWARHSEWLILNPFIQNEVLRMHIHMHSPSFICIRPQRGVGSLKLQVSFAKEPYERDNILQKRPIIVKPTQVDNTFSTVSSLLNSLFEMTLTLIFTTRYGVATISRLLKFRSLVCRI